LITPCILQDSSDSTSLVILRILRLTEEMCAHHGSAVWDVKMQHLPNLENTTAALLQRALVSATYAVRSLTVNGQ